MTSLFSLLHQIIKTMEKLPWKPEYSVGIFIMDNQHHKLIDIINDLGDAIASNQKDHILKKIIFDIAKYAAYHFSTEELIMEKYEFPATTLHIDEHNHYREKIIDFLKSYSYRDSELAETMQDFLQQWLVNHIMETDKEFGQFLQNNGYNKQFLRNPEYYHYV